MEVTDRDREILEQLAELGLEIAAALKAQIVAQPADSAELSLAFTRVARSIRQTLACKAKLAEKQAKAAEAREGEEYALAIEAARLRFRKKQVARDVAEMMDSQGAAEDLLSDLRERLDDADIEEDLLAKQVGDVIFGLCDDFGILIDRTVWQDKGWYLSEGRPQPEPPPRPARSGGEDPLPYHEWVRLHYHTPPDG